ncbi:MAG: ATP-dependent zinc metalloprotease FtsH [Spirochaetales bacterium]|nr:ATP-dependent zinc metalloprotease FtsH [Spirochaetales bacterium]
MPGINEQDPQNNQPQRPAGGSLRTWLFLIITALVFLVPWLVISFIGSGSVSQVNYSEFLHQVNANNIKSLTVKGQEIDGEFVSPVGTDKLTAFRTYLPPQGFDNQILTKLENQNVPVTAQPTGGISLWAVLLNLLPFAVMIYLFYRVARTMRAQGQDLFQIGASRAKRFKKEENNTTFKDVAGVDAVMEELGEVVDFLKHPHKYMLLGAKTPKGILLIGPPGTGKTLLARAIASESNVPFFSISGSDFIEMFVGVGAARVRDLFRQAKAQSPSIIFIDEIDSIGRRRGTGIGGGHDEREQTLNQLLSEIDGFEQDSKTLVFAATNRPDVLDPALLRPGRFDRRITIGLPAMKDRAAILRIHARNKPLGRDVDLEEVARGTPGFSGADLENLLNEAALVAALRDKTFISQDDINAAKDKIVLGLERRNVILTGNEKRTIACHESGHALVAELLPNADPVHKVSIIPRDFTMGDTQQLQEGDKYLFSREYLMDRVTVLMAGRAAEEIMMHAVTSGAENDLKEAQRLVRKMVLDWGMGNKYRNISFGGRHQQVFLGDEIAQRHDFSEETYREIDQEVVKMLDEAYRKALALLREHQNEFEAVVTELLAHEEIPGGRIKEIIGRRAEEVRASTSFIEEGN